MIEFKPNSLYSRADLAEMLVPLGIDSDAWVARLKPKKRFRFAWYGKDMIDAIEAAPLLREREETGATGGEDAVMPKPKNRGNRRGSMLKAAQPGSAIDSYLAELRGQKG